jgi:hypothetical protein
MRPAPRHSICTFAPKKRWLYPSPGGLIEKADRINKLYPQAGKEETLVADSEQTLHSILATLEECRTGLIENSNLETARFVAVAILDIRMKLNQIGETELKALCDGMLADRAPAETAQDLRLPQGERQRPLLKVVK